MCLIERIAYNTKLTDVAMLVSDCYPTFQCRIFSIFAVMKTINVLQECTPINKRYLAGVQTLPSHEADFLISQGMAVEIVKTYKKKVQVPKIVKDDNITE